jgi:hypothetical protein
MRITTVAFAHRSVYVLKDSRGGYRWWCGACGAASQGRLLPAQVPADDPRIEEEARRLAEAHVRRNHRDSGARGVG